MYIELLSMENKIIIAACVVILGMFGINQWVWSKRMKQEVVLAVEQDRRVRREQIKLIRYEIDTITVSKPSLDSALLILGWK